MKLSSFCVPCKGKRFYEVTCLSTKSERKRKSTMDYVVKSIAESAKTKECPSFAGTKQSELIMRLTGNKDPYRKKKLDVIKRAKAIYPEFEKRVFGGETDYERFRRAAVIAVAGNALELSAPNHKIELANLRKEMWKLVKGGLACDDLKKIIGKANGAESILYLCDNCGEAVFDRLLISELKKCAPLTIAVASSPVDEDVSMKEAGLLGLGKLASVVGKGRTYGVWKEKAPKGFWKKLEGAGLIIAKGMGNYETLTEYPKLARGRTAFLFMVKCEPVGKSIGLRKGSLVAKMF